MRTQSAHADLSPPADVDTLQQLRSELDAFVTQLQSRLSSLSNSLAIQRIAPQAEPQPSCDVSDSSDLSAVDTVETDVTPATFTAGEMNADSQAKTSFDLCHARDAPIRWSVSVQLNASWQSRSRRHRDRNRHR